MCVCAQTCLSLCDPMDCSPQGSSVHGIFQERIAEWIAISYSRESSWPRSWTSVSCISCVGSWILYHCATWEVHTHREKTERNLKIKQLSVNHLLLSLCCIVLEAWTIPTVTLIINLFIFWYRHQEAWYFLCVTIPALPRIVPGIL